MNFKKPLELLKNEGGSKQWRYLGFYTFNDSSDSTTKKRMFKHLRIFATFPFKITKIVRCFCHNLGQSERNTFDFFLCVDYKRLVIKFHIQLKSLFNFLSQFKMFRISPQRFGFNSLWFFFPPNFFQVKCLFVKNSSENHSFSTFFLL